MIDSLKDKAIDSTSPSPPSEGNAKSSMIRGKLKVCRIGPGTRNPLTSAVVGLCRAHHRRADHLVCGAPP
jgi:hypothetical protein